MVSKKIWFLLLILNLAGETFGAKLKCVIIESTFGDTYCKLSAESNPGLTGYEEIDVSDLKISTDSVSVIQYYNFNVSKIPSDNFNVFLNLRELDIYYCMNIKSLHKDTFRKEMNIKELTIFRTNIASVGKEAFSKFPKLETLYIGYNEIETVDKEAFKGATKLKTISFQHNKIKTLDKNTFDGLKLLEELRLSNNPLQKFEFSFRDNPLLRTLDAYGNEIESINPAKIFSKNLTYYNFDGRTNRLKLERITNYLNDSSNMHQAIKDVAYILTNQLEQDVQELKKSCGEFQKELNKMSQSNQEMSKNIEELEGKVTELSQVNQKMSESHQELETKIIKTRQKLIQFIDETKGLKKLLLILCVEGLIVLVAIAAVATLYIHINRKKGVEN